MTRRKSNLEWLTEHLDALMKAANKVSSIRPEVYNEFWPWTTLKLIGVKYWQEVYSTIMQDHLRGLRMDSMAYLDVMAGSGLNKIKGLRCIVAGSSILAAVVPKKPFEYIVSIESVRKRASALEARLARLRSPGSFRVLRKPADQAIDEALRDLRERKAHFMAFVDYQGMKGFSRESMDKLLDAPCDIWFTFFPNIKRSWTLAQMDSANRETCMRFFGRAVHEETTFENVVAAWIDQLAARREIIRFFPIESGEGYYYLLVFMTRKTRGGSSYVRAADDLERRLSSITGDFAEKVLRILGEDQRMLEDFGV